MLELIGSFRKEAKELSWDTDKIIGAGLIIALIIYIIGIFIAACLVGVTLPLDVPGNIVTGLAGYMGRTLLDKDKHKDEKKDDMP